MRLARTVSDRSPSSVAFSWDTLGIGASTACAIHCLLAPFLLAFSPAMSHFLPGSEVIHRSFAYLLTAVGLVAFWSGYRVHRKPSVLLILIAGLAGVTVGAYADALLPTHDWEVGITLAGSTCLIVAHVLNRSLCRSCRSCGRRSSKGD